MQITTFMMFFKCLKWQLNFDAHGSLNDSFKSHRNATEKTVTGILKVVAKLIPWPEYQGFSCACGGMFRGRPKVDAASG